MKKKGKRARCINSGGRALLFLAFTHLEQCPHCMRLVTLWAKRKLRNNENAR